MGCVNESYWQKVIRHIFQNSDNYNKDTDNLNKVWDRFGRMNIQIEQYWYCASYMGKTLSKVNKNIPELV